MFRWQNLVTRAEERHKLVTASLNFFKTAEQVTKLHCKKSVLKIQEFIHEGANLKFYIPEFLHLKLLIPEYSPTGI
jgi:hypothetical protein